MPKIDRAAIYERDGGLCAFCGQPVPWELMHLDHRQPRGLGGPTTPENLRVAHRRCNIAAGHDVIRKRRQLGLPATPGLLSLRVPIDLLDQLRKIAESQDRSLNAQIVRALREWLVLHGNDD